MTRPTDTRPAQSGSYDADLPVETDDDEYSDGAVSAVFGSLERSGDWIVADRLEVRAILGEVKLDFCEAELPPDEIVELHCSSILGEIRIIVPEGSEVEMEGVSAVFGELKQRRHKPRVRSLLGRLLRGEDERKRRRPEPDGEGPLFVVTGQAILGNISIVTR